MKRKMGSRVFLGETNPSLPCSSPHHQRRVPMQPLCQAAVHYGIGKTYEPLSSPGSAPTSEALWPRLVAFWARDSGPQRPRNQDARAIVVASCWMAVRDTIGQSNLLGVQTCPGRCRAGEKLALRAEPPRPLLSLPCRCGKIPSTNQERYSFEATMTITVEATYKNGVLKPKKRLKIPDGTKVRIAITRFGRSRGSAGQSDRYLQRRPQGRRAEPR